MNRDLDKVQVLGKGVVALPFQFTVGAAEAVVAADTYPSASVLSALFLASTGSYRVATADSVLAIIAASANAVVVGGLSAVTAAGTTPPTVTVSGMPNYSGYSFKIEITTGGARGTAKFRWSVNGGVDWSGTNVTTAATVVLGDTGVTVAFAVGTYATDNEYTFTPTATWDGKVDVVTLAQSGVELQVRKSSDGTAVALPAGAVVTGVIWQRNSTVTV